MQFDPTGHPPTITAVILAGSRPGSDPMAQAAGVTAKALIPVAGQAMLARVARTLVDHDRIGRVVVLSQRTDELVEGRDTAWMAGHEHIAFVTSGSGISSSLLALIGQGEVDYPLLVTTADNVLLTHEMIDSFVGGAEGADLAVAMVERRVLLSRYPQSRRTWLKFRGGWWSGANLFWLASSRAAPVVGMWQNVEQDRKKGLKIISAFGPMLFIAVLLRLLTIHQAAARAGRRFGLCARVVPMAQAEACIDIDKPADKELAEAILEQRR